MEKDDKKKKYSSRRRPGGGPMHMMGAGGQKANDFKGSMKKLLKYLAPYRVTIIIVLILAILGTIFAIVSPKILGNVTNEIVDDLTNITVYNVVQDSLPEGVEIPAGTTGEAFLKQLPENILSKIPDDQVDKIKKMDLSIKPSIDYESIGETMLMLVGLYLLSAFFNYIQSWMMAKVSQEVTYTLREEVFAKINRLPLKYYDKHPIGDTLSRITNDIDTIGQTLSQSLVQIITSFITIIGILIMMLSISWILTLVAVLILPVSFGIVAIIVKNSQHLFKEQQDQLGEINGHIEETYAGHNIVKAYNGEDDAIEEFNEINERLYSSGWKSQFYSGLMWPIMNFISNIGYVLVATIGGWLAFNGRIGIGDIQAFIQYLNQFNQPVMQVGNTTNVLQSTAASAERVFEFLEEEEEPADVEDPVELTAITGDIDFNNVSFGYDPETDVIKDLSLDVKPGQRVAIVGPTGGGKTTLVNLLMRFYDVDSGSITIDGVDIRKMRRSDLRNLFGMVLQNTWLFKGTIRENIAYGNQDATEEEILVAAKSAQVDHFVHSLPQGYDLVLDENSDNVSEGEKQLLTIARAMLADPPVLILDEATSSVDTRTEVLIQKAMDKLLEGRTSFVIAHRLSTIKNADLIAVIHDGELVEKGTHKELIAKNGFYKELYESQFEE